MDILSAAKEICSTMDYRDAVLGALLLGVAVNEIRTAASDRAKAKTPSPASKPPAPGQ